MNVEEAREKKMEKNNDIDDVQSMEDRIINELEEQQCHLCGDESFDAGWKAGLEKAIETIKEMNI